MLSKALIMALVLVESGGNPIAQSGSGAEGLCQMTPIGIEEVHRQYGRTEEVNIFNPKTNITYGVLLLEHYYEQTGSIKSALILFNSGYMGLLRYRQGGINALPEETKAYVPKVLATMRSLDPMFSRILPERRERSYLETAIDDVFYDLYGVGEGVEQVVFGPGVLPN
jgi:soluble lytic murein transglycosylase-like protein